MIKYNKEKVNKEIDKLISISRLQKQVANVLLKSLEIFLYVNVNRIYQRHTIFTQALLHKYIISLYAIMTNLAIIGNNNIFLHNNITKSLLLKDRTIS